MSRQDFDPDSKEMKALRRWMVRVNNILHREGFISGEHREELHDAAMEATGWDDDG